MKPRPPASTLPTLHFTDDSWKSYPGHLARFAKAFNLVLKAPLNH